MLVEILYHRHYLGDTSLVVRTQKRGAVCDNDIIADILFQVGKLFRAHYNILFFVEHDIAAVIIFYHTRFHVMTGKLRRRIDVRAKPYRRHTLTVCGYPGVYASRFRYGDFAGAAGFQLFREQQGQIPLFFRAGHSFLVICRFRIRFHIFYKSIEDRCHYYLSFLFMLRSYHIPFRAAQILYAV
ncbi:hypothetical protein SDC9_125122 [bioreactor metagenome]|uniref:Uncharacterized protein n=1 Tax=bioreactor metagenome TaxID=1076179 RepID=A0A645CMD7_9ZZZZ